MAKITLSADAPAEAVHFTFAGDEFDLSGKKKYETTDDAVIGNALVHPWLSVEFPEVEIVQGAFHDQLAPEDDALTAKGRKVNPNDPEAARAAEAAKTVDDSVPVALDAGLTQTEVVTAGDTALTLAADPTSKTSDKVDKN